MKTKKDSSQTAYTYNAHSSSNVKNTVDHGWAKVINRMIDQRYAFIDLEYENKGYLFRGMNSGLFDSLLNNNFWHYAGEDSCSIFEKELDVLFLSQDFSDAFTLSKIWKQKTDACILIIKSDLFNIALKEKKAAVMATAEPGIVFKYPFLSHPLNLNDIEYLIVSKNIIQVTPDKKAAIRNIDLIEKLDSLGKLIYAKPEKENYDRSFLEEFLTKKLLEKDVVGAKTVKSHLKPSRKN